MKRKLLYGVIAAIAVTCVIAPSILKLGLVAVNADQSPPTWEARLLGIAVHASVVRHAAEQPNPVLPADKNLIAGAEIYKEMCARCHGLPNARPSILGASFYPPAPHLPGHPTGYTEAELFWIVKHGIRNTSMPAWRNLLSDQDIWQVVALVKRFDALPPVVKADLSGRPGPAGQ